MPAYREDPPGSTASSPSDRAGPSAREQLIARIVVVIVGAGTLIIQLFLLPMGRPPGWDESIYLPQVTPGMDAMLLRAFRARGITYLVAPITFSGGSVEQVRLFLTVLSSFALATASSLTVPLIGMAAPIAAVFFSFTWLFLFNGSAILPNLWAALLILATTGLAARVLEEKGNRLTVLAAVALAATAIFRPTEAVAAFGAIAISVLVWRRASWRLIIALGSSLVLGLLPWIVEISIRFGGPVHALGVAHNEQNLSLVDAGTNLATYLAATGGDASADIPFAGALWWSVLVVLAVVGVARSNRSRRTVVMLCGVGALVLGFEYIGFVEAVAPRFLLPAYALAAVPAAVGLVSLLRGGMVAQSIGVLVLLFTIPWTVWQSGVAGRVADEQMPSLELFREAGVRVREMAGGRPCAFLSPHGWPAIEFASGCTGSALPSARGPSQRELLRLASGGRRVYVILRARPRPRSMLASIEATRIRGRNVTWFIYELPKFEEASG
jgi:hypothetical protein